MFLKNFVKTFLLDSGKYIYLYVKFNVNVYFENILAFFIELVVRISCFLFQTFLEQTKTQFNKNHKGMSLDKITTTVGLNSKCCYIYDCLTSAGPC